MEKTLVLTNILLSIITIDIFIKQLKSIINYLALQKTLKKYESIENKELINKTINMPVEYEINIENLNKILYYLSLVKTYLQNINSNNRELKQELFSDIVLYYDNNFKNYVFRDLLRTFEDIKPNLININPIGLEDKIYLLDLIINKKLKQEEENL